MHNLFGLCIENSFIFSLYRVYYRQGNKKTFREDPENMTKKQMEELRKKGFDAANADSNTAVAVDDDDDDDIIF